MRPSSAEEIRPVHVPVRVRTVPVWIAVLLTLGALGTLLAAVFHFGDPWLWRSSHTSAETAQEQRHHAAEPVSVSRPAAAGTSSAALTPVIPPAPQRVPLAHETDLWNAIDYLRMRALADSDYQAAHEAADQFGNWSRSGHDPGALTALVQRSTRRALELARRRTESILVRIQHPVLTAALTDLATRAQSAHAAARDAESRGDFATALRLQESLEEDVLAAWAARALELTRQFEEARLRVDRAEGLRLQREITLWNDAVPVPPSPLQVVAAAPTSGPAVAAPARYVVDRDPVPPGVFLWEAERIAVTSTGVRTDPSASGGRYATQAATGRPVVEFGLPPALDTITVWVKMRGAAIVFESAEPGRPRVEHGRTDGGTASWEWKRIGTFQRSALGSTLALSNYDANAWSGIDVVLLSAHPGIQPH